MSQSSPRSSNASPSGELPVPVLRFSRAELDCPVCPRGGIEPGCDRCPNCGSDLRPLWTLRDLPDQLRERAESALQSGDAESALECLRGALALGGEDPELRARIGTVYWERGEHAAARAQWQRGSGDAHCDSLLRQAERRAARGRLARGAGALAVLLGALGLVWVALPLLRDASVSDLPAVGAGGFSAVASPRPEPGVRPVSASADGFERLARRLQREPGVIARRGRGTLVIGFVEPLFPEGAAQPSARAELRLRRVTRLLDDEPAGLVVAVAGSGDGGAEAVDRTLARARALRAIAVMAAELRPSGRAALRLAGADAWSALGGTPRLGARGQSLQLHISVR